MTSGEFDADALKEALSSAQISEEKQQQSGLNHKDDLEDGGVQITCFSDVFNDVALHFQILRLPKQVLHQPIIPPFASSFSNCEANFYVQELDSTNLHEFPECLGVISTNFSDNLGKLAISKSWLVNLNM